MTRIDKGIKQKTGTLAMIITLAHNAEFSIEEWQRRLEVQDLSVWYEWYKQQTPENHTNLDLETADLTKEEEEQLLTINKKPRRKSSQQTRPPHLEPMTMMSHPKLEQGVHLKKAVEATIR